MAIEPPPQVSSLSANDNIIVNQWLRKVWASIGGLTGIIPVSSGGTGLGTLGAALDVLRVNASGTALEYASVGGGAPTNASYLTLGLNAGLSAERVLTAGTGISFTDTGANGTLTINCTVTGGAPVGATYITQTSDGTLTNEQALSGLATGLLKNTTGTGVLSIAVAGTDYLVSNQTITLSGDATGSGTTAITVTVPGLAGKVDTTRTINTTAPLSGGGDLSANRTLSVATFSSSASGVVPASGGGTTNFLRADGTWAAPPGGGGGSPGGSTTQIQYNNAGAFAGDADFTWDASGNVLTLGGVDTGIVLAGITNEPATPSSGTGRLYAKAIAGKMTPKWKGPSGLDFPLQSAFWQNNIVIWSPTTATAGLWLGSVGAGSGTYSTALPTDTNLYTSMKRARWANVVTTTNQVLGQRNTEAMFYRGSAVSGAGGFFFYTRCGMDVWTNGGRFFAGMHSATTVVSAEPSALNNTVGFCVDSGDAGAISFLTRGTAATKAPTGFTFASNTGFDLYIFCAPGSSQYTWRIVSITAGTEASGTATLNLPTNTTKLTAGVLASNAALTAATAIQLGVNRIYIETHY